MNLFSQLILWLMKTDRHKYTWVSDDAERERETAAACEWTPVVVDSEWKMKLIGF